MFNIIETPRNYFTRELLRDNLSSDVALHFNVSYSQPYLVLSCSEEVFLPVPYGPCEFIHFTVTFYKVE